MDMIKAAIYARVSTDAQSENSIPDQIRECQNYASKEGWAIYGTYTDEAISGADVSRAEYTRLKSDALTGKFQYIIVDDLSRIGRDMPEFASLYQDLTEMGVYIIGVSDGIDTSKSSAKLPIYFKGIMNEMFLDDLKARIVRGLKGQVMRGYSAGGRIYGFSTESLYDPDGTKDRFGRVKRIGCRISVDQEQAQVIKRIFSMKESGLGYKTIAKSINSEGIPSPHAHNDRYSGLWNPISVRGILTNKKYIGIWDYNKTHWVKKRIQGKRKSIPNRPSEWITYRSEDLRIISDEQFIAVNSAIQKENRKSRPGRKVYLLSGLLKCADCGGSLVVQRSGEHFSYSCNTARSKGPSACRLKFRIHKPEIENALLSAIIDKLVDLGALDKILLEANRIITSYHSAHQPDCQKLEKRKAGIKSQIDNLIAAIERGEYSEIIHNRLRQREEELLEIEKELTHSAITPLKRTEMTIDWLRQKLYLLRDLIDNHNNRPAILRNELMNLFPDHIKVTPYKAGNRVGFTLYGEAKPFNLVFPEKVSKSLIAVQGLEPRTRGL